MLVSPLIKGNQMEKKMENYMETVIYIKGYVVDYKDSSINS